MSKAQINKAKTALQRMENAVKDSSKRINTATIKLKKCKKNIKAHITKLKEVKEALIKNKISTNMMVKEGYIQDVDEYTEHVNALFNSLIRSADNILQD